MPKRLSKEMKCIECGREYTATYISGSKPRRTCGVECQGELARRRGKQQAAMMLLDQTWDEIDRSRSNVSRANG